LESSSLALEGDLSGCGEGRASDLREGDNGIGRLLLVLLLALEGADEAGLSDALAGAPGVVA
jgi:hypothetical protein